MIKIGIDPVIATVLGFDLRWYSLIVMLSVIVVIAWAWRQARRTDILEVTQAVQELEGEGSGEKEKHKQTMVEAITSLALWAIPGGIIGSRLVHVIDQLDFYLAHPRAIIGGEGQAIFGAVLGATLAVWVGNKLTTKLPFGRLMDLIAPGVLLGQALGRVANIINGDAYGSPTDLPWGFVYTHPDSYGPQGIATHPSPVYEMLWDLALFGLIFKLQGRLKPQGSLFVLYLALYSIGRFFISYTRVNSPFLVSGLNQAQVIALLILAITIPFLVMRTRWARTS